MLNAFTFFFKVFGNRPIWGGGFQKFDFTFTHGEKCGCDFLFGNGFHPFEFKPQRMRPKIFTFFDTFYSNPQMIDFKNFHQDPL